MANPSSVSEKPAILEATTTQDTVALDPWRRYSLSHNQVNTAGAGATQTIYLATAADVTASADSGADKAALIDIRTLVIGPGVSVLRFKTAAGSPTFTIVPHRH